MDYHQILRVCLPQEDLKLVIFSGVSGNNCCHGNTFKFFGLNVCGCSTGLSESNYGLVLKINWLPYLPYWNEKTTSWKSWSANLLQVSNLTFDPSFKVM